MYGAAGAADRPWTGAAEVSGAHGGSSGAVNRLVVFADACGSGSMGMETKKRMREALYAAFAEAFGAVGVVPGRLHQEDRGDGILAALPTDVPPSLMVGRWLSTLYENLREHNHGRSDLLRLRVGMHMGPVLDDGRGLVGRAVDLACRLCDSDSAKRVMAAAPESELMIVVSDWLYTEVVADGGRHIEPRQYRSGRVRSKETDETAWFHVPGLAEPPMDAVTAARGSTAANQAAEPGRDDGPQKGGGPSSPGEGAPQGQLGGLTQEFNVEGDNLSVTGSTIYGGFTGIRKEHAAPRERRRAPEGESEGERRPAPERESEGEQRPAPEREPDGERRPAPEWRPEGEQWPRPEWVRDDEPRRGVRPGLPRDPWSESGSGSEGERDDEPWHGARPGLPRAVWSDSEAEGERDGGSRREPMPELPRGRGTNPGQRVYPLREPDGEQPQERGRGSGEGGRGGSGGGS